jgi:hypothetical protein
MGPTAIFCEKGTEPSGSKKTEENRQLDPWTDESPA